MPYIKKERRELYDKHIEQLITKIMQDVDFASQVPVGDLNYIISKLIWNIFDSTMSYTVGNNLIEVLECVKKEFYRRKLAVYEDEKIKVNGDI